MADSFDGTSQSHPSNNPDGMGRDTRPTGADDPINLICGPLINYQGMDESARGVSWHGSVLIVVEPGPQHPILELRPVGSITETESSGFVANMRHRERIEGLKLYSDPKKTFWRFSFKIPLTDAQTRWQYSVANIRFRSKIFASVSREFVVPSVNQSMRIMFHSCNGFSVGTDEEFWSGPILWNNVLEIHQKRPFHVMIGGGDQIYNDSVRVKGPLKKWTDISNPKRRRDHPFGEDLRMLCDNFYYENYVHWFSAEPFASANSSIPQINIWDDHDIIDGFGSYTDHFMRCAVFRGIGGVSFKYYCLFQHHTAPPVATFTTDAPATMHAAEGGTAGIDPRQTKDTYVYQPQADNPSWIVGNRPGPYVAERSRSLYLRLGKRMAFCGIDARTERTRRQVNYPETYDLIFGRLQAELRAAKGQIKHLIFLLGIPVAYPRLAWLENFLSSPLIAPIKLLHKRFGFAGSLFNKFDGKADLLDDLDDHYTAKHHKLERKQLIMRLQDLAQQFSVRITILSGDVHLGAVGRFYSAPGLRTPAEQDHRYMANIISSAITNKPPPKVVADLLARRNKIHHLKEAQSDETLLHIFDKQPGGQLKGGEWNKCTMPSRNFACITEVEDEAPAPMVDGNREGKANRAARDDEKYTGNDGHSPLHRGEDGAGTLHPAADGVSSRSGLVGGLDVALRVEIDNHDRRGTTEGYGFSIPPLTIPSTATQAPQFDMGP